MRGREVSQSSRDVRVEQVRFFRVRDQIDVTSAALWFMPGASGGLTGRKEGTLTPWQFPHQPCAGLVAAAPSASGAADRWGRDEHRTFRRTPLLSRHPA